MFTLFDFPAPVQLDDAPSASYPALTISSVGKCFTRTDTTPLRVLDDINFTVQPGRITAIVGASGCGKSTLLNMIAGLMATDQGQILLEGVPVGDFTDWNRVGYLFQDDRLLPWRTALQNVEFGLEADRMGSKERHELACQALESVGLTGFFDAYPNALSGGMRSRVALARSLVREPRILLLDEPFSKLDPGMRAQMHSELLQAQSQRQLTVLFVTHDIEEAVVLADEVVVLQPRPGRVRERVLIELPRPRRIVDQAVGEQVRALRALV